MRKAKLACGTENGVERSHVLYDNRVKSCGIVRLCKNFLKFLVHATMGNISYLFLRSWFLTCCVPKTKAVVAYRRETSNKPLFVVFCCCCCCCCCFAFGVPEVINKAQVTHFAMLRADGAIIGGPHAGWQNLVCSHLPQYETCRIYGD